MNARRANCEGNQSLPRCMNQAQLCARAAMIGRTRTCTSMRYLFAAAPRLRPGSCLAASYIPIFPRNTTLSLGSCLDFYFVPSFPLLVCTTHFNISRQLLSCAGSTNTPFRFDRHSPPSQLSSYLLLALVRSISCFPLGSNGHNRNSTSPMIPRSTRPLSLFILHQPI